jgi:hypothetical protein
MVNGTSQAKPVRLEESARVAIAQAISGFDADGFAQEADQQRIEATLAAFPPQTAVAVLEELYRGASDPLKRSQAMSGLVVVQQGAEDRLALERAQAVAQKALFDPNPHVAIMALRLLWCAGGPRDPKVLRLVERRIAESDDPELLRELFDFAPVRGNQLLLAELRRSPPRANGAVAAWTQRMSLAMESCCLDPDQAPAELADRLVHLILRHPPLSEAGVKCLVSLRDPQSLVRLDRQQEHLPQAAQDAIRAGLAVLDPGAGRIDALKVRLLRSAENEVAPEGIRELESRYGLLCYVAAESRDQSLSLWLVDFARACIPPVREMLLQRFVLSTLNTGYLQLLGINQCTDSELSSLFKAKPEQAEIVEGTIRGYKSQRCTPPGLRDSLEDISARLKTLIERTDGPIGSGAP